MTENTLSYFTGDTLVQHRIGVYALMNNQQQS